MTDKEIHEMVNIDWGQKYIDEQRQRNANLINSMIGFAISILFWPLVWLLLRIRMQMSNLTTNYLCALFILTILYLSYVTFVMLLWALYNSFMHYLGMDYKKVVSRGRNKYIMYIFIFIFVLSIAPLLLLFALINKIVTSNTPTTDLITYLFLIPIDEEQKCLFYDARAEWKRLNLNSWQITRKGLVFILLLYWGKFIAWCNYEDKRPRA